MRGNRIWFSSAQFGIGLREIGIGLREIGIGLREIGIGLHKGGQQAARRQEVA